MSGRGQTNFYDRAAGFGVARGNFSAMLLDDSVANAQAQASALAHALGGIKRFEDSMWLFQPGAGILKLDDYFFLCRLHQNLQAALGGVWLFVVHHRVQRIVDNIEKDLL